jgi:hypothetical protein
MRGPDRTIFLFYFFFCSSFNWCEQLWAVLD